MRLMNHVMQRFIGKHGVVYFDDILTHSKDLKEHLQHLRDVFEVQRQEKLFGNFKKCHFCQYRVTFLEFLVSQHEI